MNPDSHTPGFDRDGHLTELALARTLYGAGVEGASEAAARHLAACATCAAVRERMQAEDAALAIPLPSPAVRARADLGAAARRRAQVARLAGVLLAIAAALVLVVGVGHAPAGSTDGDRFRPRGAAFELDVHVHDGSASHLVESGGVVHVGDRAGFEVLLGADGFLIVAGMDDAGDIYPCYPQELDPTAVFMHKTSGRVLLPTAVEFDEAAGDEHIFGLLCAEPYRLDELRPALYAAVLVPSLAPVPAGCSLERIDLHKPEPHLRSRDPR